VGLIALQIQVKKQPVYVRITTTHGGTLHPVRTDKMSDPYLHSLYPEPLKPLSTKCHIRIKRVKDLRVEDATRTST
jgi:hypothetical protein